MFLDPNIVPPLISQVTKAVPARGSERDVITLITRLFWRAWCAAVGLPENCEPGEWEGINSRRVYGSETVIVEGEDMRAMSFAR